MMGRFLCRRGYHAKLQWRHHRERRVAITNQPMEMMNAAGLGQFMTWIGWCPRCDRAVEWADHEPSLRVPESTETK